MPRRKKDPELERLAEVIERAPKELEPLMKQALRDLNKGLPPATSSELLCSRMSW